MTFQGSLYVCSRGMLVLCSGDVKHIAIEVIGDYIIHVLYHSYKQRLKAFMLVKHWDSTAQNLPLLQAGFQPKSGLFLVVSLQLFHVFKLNQREN